MSQPPRQLVCHLILSTPAHEPILQVSRRDELLCLPSCSLWPPFLRCLVVDVEVGLGSEGRQRQWGSFGLITDWGMDTYRTETFFESSLAHHLCPHPAFLLLGCASCARKVEHSIWLDVQMRRRAPCNAHDGMVGVRCRMSVCFSGGHIFPE